MHGRVHRWQPWLVEAQPQAYVEISEELAKEKGIANGERSASPRRAARSTPWLWSRCASRPSSAEANRASGGHDLQLRLAAAQGMRRHGKPAQSMVGDANSMTPEYKAFMVNIDKIKA